MFIAIKSRLFKSGGSITAMKRYLDQQILNDLPTKMVVLTGPRQVGKTTLSRQLVEVFSTAQYLKWDVLADRAILQRQSWNPRAKLLVMDEIHKKHGWKGWLKGVFDGRSAEQALLVTGSARMETFRQGGDFTGRTLFCFPPASVFGA
jgi:uncharacterized protein